MASPRIVQVGRRSLPVLGAGFAANVLAFARTRLFELAVLLWSLAIGAIVCTYFQLVRRPHEVRRMLRLWSAGFIFAARWIVGLRWHIEGAERVPARPVIYVCNHQSYWESIAFTVIVPDINVVTKRAAMAIPVFGWGLRHAPMIGVDRDQPGSNLRRIVRDAHASLVGGRSVLIFPEGTRVPPGGRLRYQRGLQAIYQQCGVAIVPVVHNAGLFWSKGFALKRPGMVTVRVLPPIEPGRDAHAVAAEIEQLLNTEKDRLPGIEVAGAS